jgi:hypothetical protein
LVHSHETVAFRKRWAELEKSLRSILPGTAEQFTTFVHKIARAAALYYRVTRPISEDLSHRSARLNKARRATRPFGSAIQNLDQHLLSEIIAELDHVVFDEIITLLNKASSGRAKLHSNALVRGALQHEEYVNYVKMAGLIAQLLSLAIDRVLAKPHANKIRHRGRGERVTEAIEDFVETLGAAYRDTFGKAPSATRLGIFPRALIPIFEMTGIGTDVALGEKKLIRILAPVRAQRPAPKRRRKKRPL